MEYNFDEIIERRQTDCVKYDLSQLIFQTQDVLPMWVADMDFKTPDFILSALHERLQHPVLGYSFRSETYNQAIIQWVNDQHQWKIESKWIDFSPGVVPGIGVAIQALTNPGDKIIIQPPVYFPFFSSIKGNNRKLVSNELKLAGGKYCMDFEALEKQIDKDTKMLILCNPHNPVGRCWSRAELEQLLDICLKHHLIIISDEIHSDLVFAPHKHIPLASLSEAAADCSITFMSPSKTFNMAGMGTSFAVIPNDSLHKRYNHLLEVAHLHIGTVLGSVASTAAYNHGALWKNELMKYLKENLDMLESFLEKNLPEIKLIKPEGTYLMWLDCRALQMNDDELNQFFINEARLGLNAGNSFGSGGSGFMRMNIACPGSVLQEALERMKNAVKKR